MPDSLGTVLVTGGAGFIGSTLSHALAPRSERWVVVDSLLPQVHGTGGERPAALHPAAELVVADVTDRTALDAVVADVRPEVIVHLAAETGTAQSLDESSRHALVNVVGTTQLLDALTAADHVPDLFVLASSRAVYGEGVWRHADGREFQPGLRTHAQLERGEWDHPGSVHLANSATTTPAAPINVYGATKLAQEHLLGAWAGSRDSHVSVLRLQNVYGPGQSLTNPYTGIVSLFSQLARAGRSIPVYEDGAITRDFVYIDDVVSALAEVVSERVRLPRPVDIGTGVRTTILDVARAIAEYHGAPAPRITGAFRDGDVRHAACDITATEELLTWRPRWDLPSGVAALQTWIADELDAGAEGLE
ncbi:GDP-mannose 4,6-dehydratase [Galbitalea sp. SE-J8]|uniref:NAD-dependent epimerase/dehydratase family protein n=1 Tax=Galbitalea sp. SE-J8 TaxID=3054952 RepID=UPI00259C9A18|nr:NAD-dependent epimerase/dehydratase family protein [Galbitalea sp. SE-J8]MDM4762951.1 GDP-mannose 4,6-dehydratase [Galbitalea sp. SE-J8]